MSKQETIVDIFTNAAPVWPGQFSGIAGIFQAWAQAFDLSRDPSETVKAEAKRKMEHLWDNARDLPPRSAADMAAIYIMSQNTIAIDGDAYLDDAWRIVAAASGETELAQLYSTWLELRHALETLHLDDEAGDGIGKVLTSLETQMAAIPATTAKGLAIKVDVFRNFNKDTAELASLHRDLASLTGVDKRPD